MKTYNYAMGGQNTEVNCVEVPEDLDRFAHFIEVNPILGVDTETTGLDVYSSGFKLRLVQFGNARESWVLPIETIPECTPTVIKALHSLKNIVIHNSQYDIPVLNKTLGVEVDLLWPKVIDTKILAHLVDPRSESDGGIGNHLEDLTRAYICPRTATEVKQAVKRLASEARVSYNDIWALLPIDHPEYRLYAGIDPILAYRLYIHLLPLVPATSRRLIPYEHKLAEVCSRMSQTGFLLDVDYSRELSDHLASGAVKWAQIASEYGCGNINSPMQVAEALQKTGVVIKDTTPTGKPKVNNELLDKLVEKDNPVAMAVVEGKKAGKWRTTWVDKFLKTRDDRDRCHPWINTLGARTARMSITGIPAQTLPSDDWIIRRCFLADPGHRILSVDYQAQELRVLAALSHDEAMVTAFTNNEDLHLVTARAAFGDHVSKDGVERRYAKIVNFGRVYGGGAKVVAAQAHIDLATAKRVVEGFDKAYPGVRRFSEELRAYASRNGYVTTPTGRRLPVDKDKIFAAVNYMVQSTSRDVTGAALIRLHEAGITPYLRLPIHDEVLLSVPTDTAEDAARVVAEIMTTTMGEVEISTDFKLGQRSWGSLYGAED